jgi:hypothetical protein
MGKAKEQRRQMCPITSGAHSLTELAELRQQGLSWEVIAQRWGLRPRAGADDLLFDLWIKWKRSGCPGGVPAPSGDGPESNAAWQAWRDACDIAISRWLQEQIKDGVPLNHCPTCRCHRPAGLPA